MFTLQQMSMCVRLYEARDSAKRLAGEDYGNKISECGGLVEAAAEKWKCDILPAAIRLAKECDDEIMQMWILAAAVESIEPSE